MAANLDLMRPSWDPRVEVVAEIPPDLPPLFQNPANLHQIVLNLLLNARDALHDKLDANPGARAAVTVRLDVPPGLSLPGAGGQRLTVSDTGVGMPREVLERIFEPFFTTKEVGRGTGLGLATVWHLVEACGGRVSVESTPGAGTTFRVELPVGSDMPPRPVLPA